MNDLRDIYKINKDGRKTKVEMMQLKKGDKFEMYENGELMLFGEEGESILIATEDPKTEEDGVAGVPGKIYVDFIFECELEEEDDS